MLKVIQEQYTAPEIVGIQKRSLKDNYLSFHLI